MAPEIKPFKIAISDEKLQQLRERLASSTLPSEVEFSDDWSYGVPRADIHRLTNRWQGGFDWRAQEAILNKVPQFTTKVNVDGFGELNMHFVHQRSNNPGSIPLLFCHGWPGSFLEVVKLLPLLTSPKEGQSFHVVAPSLPNFGFSDGVQKRGFSVPQYAEAVHKVMLNLGYDKYVTQGGDWGFIITRMLAMRYPEHSLATHLNFVRVAEPPSLTKNPWQYLMHAISPYDAQEKAGLARSQWFRQEGFGYNLLQATKPSTLGFALADSPVALLAWIYEKLRDWTDSYPWTDDEALAWISIYYFSTAGAEASVRIYYENMHSQAEYTRKGLEWVGTTKLGLSWFPKDLLVPPRTWGRTLGPVCFENFHKDGGHFAAYERPEELADDLRRMFGQGGGAHDITQRIASSK